MVIQRELLSINFRAGRRRAADMIVVHATEGSADSVRSWFNAPVSQVSSHFMVQKDGTIVQFVDLADEAWHAGRVSNPTAPLVLERPGVNPNSYSIGIEHENNGAEVLTDAQFAASVALHQWLSSTLRIPLDRRHVVGHHEVFDGKTCPGKIDIDAILASASVGHETTSNSMSPQAPLVRWSGFLQDWIIVTQYNSDSDWSFVPLKRLGTPIKAGALLSEMPKEAPARVV